MTMNESTSRKGEKKKTQIAQIWKRDPEEEEEEEYRFSTEIHIKMIFFC